MTETRNPPPSQLARPPLQERSRENWERVLAVGLDLFAERGWQGLTIAEVCRRAEVTAPSIYARVDGKSGLFRAVHDRWLADANRSEREITTQVEGVGDHDPAVASAAAAEIVVRIFREHEAMLRAVSDRSPHDPGLHASGSTASREMLRRVAATVPLPRADIEGILRTVYAECVLRLRYGPEFLAEEAEDDEAFLNRMQRTARRLAAAPPIGGADEAVS